MQAVSREFGAGVLCDIVPNHGVHSLASPNVLHGKITRKEPKFYRSLFTW